jgi:hypothetical protein
MYPGSFLSRPVSGPDSLPSFETRLSAAPQYEVGVSDEVEWRDRPDAGDRREVESTAGEVHHYSRIEDAEMVLSLIGRHAHLARAEAAIDGNVEPAPLQEPMPFATKRS